MAATIRWNRLMIRTQSDEEFVASFEEFFPRLLALEFNELECDVTGAQNVGEDGYRAVALSLIALEDAPEKQLTLRIPEELERYFRQSGLYRLVTIEVVRKIRTDIKADYNTKKILVDDIKRKLGEDTQRRQALGRDEPEVSNATAAIPMREQPAGPDTALEARRAAEALENAIENAPVAPHQVETPAGPDISDSQRLGLIDEGMAEASEVGDEAEVELEEISDGDGDDKPAARSDLSAPLEAAPQEPSTPFKASNVPLPGPQIDRSGRTDRRTLVGLPATMMDDDEKPATREGAEGVDELVMDSGANKGDADLSSVEGDDVHKRNVAKLPKVSRAWLMDNESGEVREIGDEIMIGREKPSDWVIPVQTISKRHFRVYRDADHYYLQDINATNGTFLNEAQVKGPAIPLRESDQVVVAITLKHPAGARVFTFLTKDPFADGEG